MCYRKHATEPSCKNLPKFLARTGYKNPTDSANSNYTDVTPERYTFFEHVAQNAEIGKYFGGFMLGQLEYRVDWTDIYDSSELLDGFDASNKDNKLLVDVGGNHGHDLLRLLVRMPDLPAGLLVLQDLPGVLEHAEPHDKIIKMPHDFFTPQPVTGK